MRLNFNIVVVDNDFEDPDDNKCRAIKNLITDITTHINKKGYTPKFFKYISLDSFLNNESIDGEHHFNRIDFYLSDNNLEVGENKNGIDLYLELKKSQENKILCDFVLYTRSEFDEIVNKLSKRLKSERDPNLFSRFTFISRPSDVSNIDWHNNIISLLDHVISQREEINLLRGLFAQVTARMHNKLREKLKNNTLSFSCTINEAHQNNLITSDLKNLLHTQRYRRNGIIHNDEYYDDKEKEFKIRCKDKNDGDEESYGHSRFCELRECLNKTEKELLKQLENVK